MADRILGMGDVVSLVEKAAEQIDEEDAMRMAKRMQSSKFDFNDFLSQMKFMRKLGPLESLLGMLPGMGKLKDMKVDEKRMKHTEAIVLSMTRQERTRPEIINGSRRKRIANGSGRPGDGGQPVAQAVRHDAQDDEEQGHDARTHGPDDGRRQRRDAEGVWILRRDALAFSDAFLAAQVCAVPWGAMRRGWVSDPQGQWVFNPRSLALHERRRVGKPVGHDEPGGSSSCSAQRASAIHLRSMSRSSPISR